MNIDKSNWNYQEFKTYLLLYAANADFVMQKEEKQLILSKASYEEYHYIKKVFETDSDFERIETILSFREQFFSTEEKVEELINEVIILLDFDENFNKNEKNFINLFRKILHNK